MYKYLKVSPPSRHLRHGEPAAYYFSLEEYNFGGTELWPILLSGKSVCAEDLLKEKIANCPDPGKDKQEEKTNELISEVNQALLEIFNLLPGEFDIESDLELVEEKDEDN